MQIGSLSPVGKGSLRSLTAMQVIKLQLNCRVVAVLSSSSPADPQEA
jgi:hypothetical protein